MKRSKHSLSHYHLTSMDMGQLVPVGCLEVLPGDTFQHSTSALVRVTPQLKPVMHPVEVRIHHFYVPNRLLWSGWEDFITGESATPPPTISGASFAQGTLQDYLGVYDDASNEYSALPVRAYNSCFNTYYRDQDLVSEVAEDSLSVQRCAWGKDRFTSARPWQQKGTAITVPLGDSAPIKYDNNFSTGGTDLDNKFVVADTMSGSGAWAYGNTADSLSGYQPDSGYANNLYADLTNASGFDINEFREAFAMQRYAEARARYGSNYVDYLRYMGVRPSDGRLSRPEYLGGGKQSISFSEVLNTSSGTSSDDLGKLGGHGIGAVRSNRYRRFFEEHGWVISLMSVRPKAIYVNGLDRKWFRTTKEDFYQKELERIGQEEIYNKEVYAAHSSPDSVFGYGDRYSSYRSEKSRVSGEFRTTLANDWHLGRDFASDTALNQTFIECSPTKRCFADQTNDSLQVMVQHSVQARRMVGKYTSSKLL